MISFRGIWIIQRRRSDFVHPSETSTSQSEFNDYAVIFSKQFPTVNQRLKVVQSHRYAPLPQDEDMCAYFKQALEFTTLVSNEVPTTDTVTVTADAPQIFRLSFMGKEPIFCVYTQSQNTFFLTVPITVGSTEDISYLSQPNLIYSINFLHSIAELCGKFFETDKKRSREELNQALNFELARKLSCCVPFGTPLVKMDNEWVKAFYKQEDPSKKAKAGINRKFTILERLVYTNEENTKDANLNIVSFKGLVQADIDLQGAPEMSLGFCVGKDGATNITQIIQNLSLYHAAVPIASVDTFATDIKISPPPYPFDLCFYTVSPELSISNTKTIQQLFTASYIIDYDKTIFKVQIVIDFDAIITRLKYDAITVEIPLKGVKMESITNYTAHNQNFSQPEKVQDKLITKVVKFDENNRAIIAFQFTADITDDASEYLRIRKPSFISDMQNAFKPHCLIKTKLSSSLSGFSIDARKITVVQAKSQLQFTTSQETQIEAIVFAQHLFGEINQ
ncbi:hypothetical protein EIN_318050 [Entamoeba invadens IP1]|uniref:MHD domain-containing protein n=1 Tax=Entamoeba invadens IP1 TaxID=370355 RepID=A0A0A1U5D9_ENTIV|nr:hypothetical protein EIN_318050 [Entamoeba invadens IP1]ELP86986.1 hypothetical protein EIN_318050 [Entamoeba invadens IP1]|eukprot:XP_004253757.1 hypothetical protein EIN_318050 [Entamoeba invadens IP1]